MTRKSLILLFAVAILVLGGAFVVMAQDNDTPTPSGPGWMHGHGRMGMMGGGFGHGMMSGNSDSMMFTLAEALGLEPEELFTAVADGQTLAEIAAAQGVELEAVYEAMLAHGEEHLTQLVEAGTLTREEADEHLTWMRENIAEMPMITGAGFGSCMGDQTGFGRGMMGHGHGMRGPGS